MRPETTQFNRSLARRRAVLHSDSGDEDGCFLALMLVLGAIAIGIYLLHPILTAIYG